jgi:hypothetical protein
MAFMITCFILGGGVCIALYVLLIPVAWHQKWKRGIARHFMRQAAMEEGAARPQAVGQEDWVR